MLPKRSNDALAGSELETILSSLDLRDRENYILSEILSGNIPEFLRSFVPVTFNTQHKDIKKTITFFVLSDYMAIGNNNDYFMIPMTPILAQKIASSLRLSFLTKKMVDLVWGSSILKLDPIPIPPSPEMTTIPVFGLHNRLIYQKRSANFENHKPFTKDAKNQMKLASQTRNLYNAESNMPNYFQTEDYHVFKIPTKITIAPKSQKQYEFLLKKEIPYKKTYHISHSIRRYRKNLSKNETIPINTSIELKAEDIGPFQLPAGSFKIYENINEVLTYIGGEQSTIKQNDDIVKINTGNTRDATCEFFIKSHEINRTHEETEIKAIFTNNKNNDIMLTMTENFYDGGWEIFQTNIEYERIDAYTAKFNLIIPSNSKKEISFKARIEKN